MYIFAYGDKCGFASNIRIIAGFTLKSSLPLLFNSESEEDKQYIRSCVLQTLIDPLVQIRNASGVIITQLVLLSSLESWAALLPALMELVKRHHKGCMTTAQRSLRNMLVAHMDDFDTPALNYPLNQLIPLFLSFFEYPDEEVV